MVVAEVGRSLRPLRARPALVRMAAVAGLVLALFAAQPRPASAQRRPDLLHDPCVLSLPGMEQVGVDTGLVFLRARGRAQALRFNLYKPPAGGSPSVSKNLPVVVFVNGVGGTDVALRDWAIYKSWGRLVAVSGMAAVTHDARPETAVADLDSLVRYLRSNAGRLGIDPENIAIWACSANVKPGSAYALDPAHTWVKCAVFYYGFVDTVQSRADLPMLVARAGLDGSWINVPLSAFIERSIAHNRTITVLNLPNAHHAFDLLDDDESSRDAVRTTLAFLKDNLAAGLQEARALRPDETRAMRAHAARDWQGVIEAATVWASHDATRGQPHQLLGDAYYQIGQFRDSAKHYEEAAALDWFPALTLYNAACASALGGDKGRALDDLEKAFATGFTTNRSIVRQDPDFASLRDDPRFLKLTERH